MKPVAGSFSLYRQVRPSGRWKSPEVPEYDPSWMVALNMPGQPRDRKLRPHLPICEACLNHKGDEAKEVPNNPAEARPNCECIKAVKRWAKEELETRTYLMQQGKIQQLQEMRTPPKLATLRKVIEVWLERGPKDRNQRRNSLASMYEQATGNDFEEMQWADLTRGLVMDWAEMRQEAGRRGWLGLGAGKNMPENGWQELRDLKRGGALPTLDRKTPMAANTTILGYLTNVKSMFGDDARQHALRGLLLPDLDHFLATELKIKKPKGHRAIETDRWTEMIEAEDELKMTNLRLWVVHQLLLRLSCRPVEVKAARKSWLDKVGSRTRIMIINRPDEDFTLKAGEGARERAIWVPDALVQAIEEVATDFSIFGAIHKTEAKELVYVKHSEWMRKFVPKGSTKTSSMLRHSGAAERMTSGDSTKAMALLGHSTTQMVESVYGTVLETLEPISDDEILRRVA